MKDIVLVDVDGTIAELGDRLRFIKQVDPDWDAFYEHCFEDEPIDNMIDLVSALIIAGYNIVFCTGRRECVREQTEKWLQHHFQEIYDPEERMLLMRPDGDHRHDTVVKPEQVRKAGITYDEIAFVLEDRNSMVAKWRELGVTCLQVREGDF